MANTEFPLGLELDFEQDDANLDDKERTTKNPRKEYIAQIREALRALNDKAEYFRNKAIEYANKPDLKQKYNDAYAAVNNILDTLQITTNHFVQGQMNLAEYKEQAQGLLSDDSADVKVLKEHRGSKEMLVNLLALILGSVAYLISAACAGRLMLFKPSTDSMSKLITVRHEFEKLVDNPALELG